MKMKVLPLLVLAALLAPADLARADRRSEIEELKTQVAELRRQVAELNRVVRSLTERVRELERAAGETEGTGESVEQPAPEPPPAVPAGGVPGTYLIDKARFEKDMIAMAMGELTDEIAQMTPEEATAMKNMVAVQIRQQAKSMKLRAVLTEGGDFSIAGRFGGEQVSARGTWTREGDTITFVTTHEDGKAMEEPEIKVAGYRDGTISVRPEKDVPFVFVLRKE